MYELGRQSPDAESESRAVDRIEAALQLAFRGEAGTQRLTRIIKALDKRQAESPGGEVSLRDHLAAAMEEIESLRKRALQRGAPLEGWLAAVANDLGSAAAVPDNAALENIFTLTSRMAAQPARALCAQAGVPRSAVHILTE